MTSRDYKTDRDTADKWDPVVLRILYANAEIFGVCRPGQIRKATEDEDMHMAADWVAPGGAIASRIRHLDYYARFGDFTIRYSRPTGTKTEYEKIVSGCARWYFLGFYKEDDIVYWFIIDLDKLRRTQLLEDAPIQGQGDNIQFKYISISDLYKAGCIVRDYQIWERLRREHTP